MLKMLNEKGFLFYRLKNVLENKKIKKRLLLLLIKIRFFHFIQIYKF